MFIYSHLGEAKASGYSGYDKLNNPMTKEVIKRQGAIDKESLEAYGQIAGTIAGAAACAVGGPLLAAVCGFFGGILGGVIAKAIPLAHGSTPADLAIQNWDEVGSKVATDTSRVTLIGITYLTMRDSVISEAVKLGMSETEADGWLSSQGLPSAPINERWRPRQERWGPYNIFLAKPDSLLKKSPIGSFCSGVSDAGFGPCKPYLMMTFLGFPPVAGPDEVIDWGLVGHDEFISRRPGSWWWKNAANPEGQGPPCAVWNANGGWIDVGCPPKDLFPSVWLSARLAILKKKAPELLMIASTQKVFKAKASTSSSSSSSTTTTKVVKVGIGAGIIWGALKLLKFL